MGTEFTHRGIRATVNHVAGAQFMWAVFPADYAEITDRVTAGDPRLAAKLAAAEACAEIDAWINAAKGERQPQPTRAAATVRHDKERTLEPHETRSMRAGSSLRPVQ
jgi:hypothetical protein